MERSRHWVYRNRLFHKCAWVAVIAIEWTIGILLYAVRVRFIRITDQRRIGQLASDVAAFVKKRFLNELAWVYPILLRFGGVAANQACAREAASARWFVGIDLRRQCVRTAGGRGEPGAAVHRAFVRRLEVAIPKLLYDRKDGRLLSFRESFASPAANFRTTLEYEASGLDVLENSADEIRDLALEMLERYEGTARYDAQDEALQARFKALLRPSHYSYGGANRVGRSFLRKYAHLLND